MGDTVRILIKKKQVGDKEWMSNFKPVDRKVESISENVGQKFSMLSHGVEYVSSDAVQI